MPDSFEVVEEDCIGCGLCAERAPENLELAIDNRIAKVFKQPETREEEQACLDACDYCPMGGIQAHAADSSLVDASAGRPHPTSVPVVDLTPVDHPLENWRMKTWTSK